MLLDCLLHIRCRGIVFTESLPGNERLFWLDYSGFRDRITLISCWIWGSHGGEYEVYGLIGCNAVQFEQSLPSNSLVSCLAYSSTLRMEAYCPPTHGVTIWMSAFLILHNVLFWKANAYNCSSLKHLAKFFHWSFQKGNKFSPRETVF
jgi:hypothetical protein